MAISNIFLQNFRSYRDEAFEFEPGVNIIVGPNASGKTNLLEALLVVARGSSYRAKDHELIASGQPWARLDVGMLSGSTRALKLTAAPRTSKTYEIDGKSYSRLPTSKTIPAIIFEPNHLIMLSGAPELRRTYLDDLLEQTVPSYGTLRKDYRRTLAQRNRLLRGPGLASKDKLFPWDVRLSELGGAIVSQRVNLLGALNKTASELYSQLAEKKTKVDLLYDAKLPYENYASAFLRQLQADFELDSVRGFTGSGPHRDDLQVWLGGHPAHITASRGEMRTALLMLKVAELRIIEERRQQKPILLLDDVFSELDGGRRRALTQFLQDYQTFITTTDADVIIQHFMNECHIIPLGEAH